MRSDRWGLLGAWLTIAACSGGPSDAGIARIDTLPSGVVRVVNRSDMAPAWRLEFVRQFGDVAGRELNHPLELAVDRAGHVYVLDDGPAVIRVFDPDGLEVGSIGREGSGPGEFKGGGMLFLSRDTLVHQDQRQSRAQAFTLDGTLIAQWKSPCCVRLPTTADDRGRFPFPGDVGRIPAGADDAGAGMGYQRFDASGRIIDTLDFPPAPLPVMWRASDGHSNWNWFVPFQPQVAHALDHRGRMIWGNQRDGTFVVSATGRDTLRIFVAEEAPPAIPDSIRRATVDALVAANAVFRGVAKLDDVPVTYPAWSGMTVDDADRIWLLRPGPAGPADHWQVFDDEGRLLAAVPTPPMDPERVRIVGDHLYAIEPDAASGIDVVRVYAIRR